MAIDLIKTLREHAHIDRYLSILYDFFYSTHIKSVSALNPWGAKHDYNILYFILLANKITVRGY